MIKTSHQIAFWLMTFVFLNLLFGFRWQSYLDSFYYVSMLMPVAIGSSYFFNLFLVPKYLANGRHFRFAIYTVYTIIVSVFFTSVVAMFSFITLADLKWEHMNPVSADIFQMGVIIYFIAIVFSFIQVYNANRLKETRIAELESVKEKNKLQTLVIRSNRKSVTINLEEILYIESLSDYVKIHTPLDTILTKEKISALSDRLPGHFIRIHRSFLINEEKLEAYGHDFIQINSEKLPLGRKYKKVALASINLSQVN